MGPIERGGPAASTIHNDQPSATPKRRARQQARTADYRAMEEAAARAKAQQAAAIEAMLRPAPRRRSKRPPRARRPQRAWAPMAMAVVVLTICAVGGGNSAFLGSLAALVELALAAMLFAQGTLSMAVLKRALPVALPLVALMVWAMLPLLGASPARAWIAPDLVPQALAKLAGAVALFFGAAMLGLKPARAASYAQALTRATALLIMATVLLRSFDLPADWQITMQDERLHRFSATLGNPNAAGVLFAMLGVVASGLAVERFVLWYDLPGERRLYDLASASVVVVGCLAMVGLTQSRSALLLGLAAEMALLLACFWPAMRQRFGTGKRWLVAGMAVVAGAMVLMAGATLDRLELVAQDGAGRQLLWQTYARAALDAPLTGYGLGSFPAWNQHSLTPATAPELWNFGAAHAAPLQVVLETGWIGLALLMLALLALGWRLMRSLRPAADPRGTAMVLAMGIACAASLADIALNVPGVMALTASLAGVLWGRALRA